jgi:hypothetical protein
MAEKAIIKYTIANLKPIDKGAIKDSYYADIDDLVYRVYVWAVFSCIYTFLRMSIVSESLKSV